MVAIDVTDEAPPLNREEPELFGRRKEAGRAIGLPDARQLAATEGRRATIAATAALTFRLLVPVAQDPASRGYRESHLGTELAGQYDTGFADPGTAQGLVWTNERELLDGLLERYADPDAHALDFACGTGRILELLEYHFPRPVGVDISAEMVDIARRKCSRAELVVGDVTIQPELVANHFDLVTAFRFFLNAEPRLRLDALTFMHRVLMPDGIAIINFHLNPWSARGLYLQARWLGRRRIPMLSLGAARKLLRGAGFEVVEVIGYDFLPYRRETGRLFAPSRRASIEGRLRGRSRLTRVAGSFIVVARPCQPTASLA